MLMTFLGSCAVDEEGFGGTSTSGVTGIEAGEGLSFFFWGLLPAALLHHEESMTHSRFRDENAERVSRKLSYYLGLLKNLSMLACELLPVSISLRRCFSFSSFLVAATLRVSRARLDVDPEAAPLFHLAGGAASGISTSDAASGLVVPVCGTRVRVPRSFSSRESSCIHKTKS
jgi:hypothetical protein